MSVRSALEGVDFDGLWDDSEYSLDSYMEPEPSDALVASIEEELGGFRLPSAYVELARIHNGGALRRNCYPMAEPTGWAPDHIAITGLYAIGRTSTYSLCGKTGSKFWEQEWGYPSIGVYFADTPTAGHEMIALDYRKCGKRGEPRVVYVDQEDEYSITVVAPDFAAFIRGLVDEAQYDSSEEDRQRAEDAVERGTLSPILVRALDAARADLPDGERKLRRLARMIVDEKGHFSLHSDARSHLMYDVVFWFYSRLRTATSFDDFVYNPKGNASYETPNYEMMIVGGFLAEPFGFCTGGYAPGFVRAWWDARVGDGEIVKTALGYRFTPAAEAHILEQLATITENPKGAI